MVSDSIHVRIVMNNTHYLYMHSAYTSVWGMRQAITKNVYI